MAHPQSPTPAETAPAEMQFMQSVTIPLHVQTPTVDPKRSMTEFKIDYQTRHDNRGKETVYKVYLPSRYKGWAITAEKKNATSSELEESSLDVFRSERPAGNHQRSSLQLPARRKSYHHKAGNPLWLNKFNKVNGVVSPSLLKPGQTPLRCPRTSKQDHSVSVQVRNKRCPICGDCFRRPCRLKSHFVACVRRNGNPQGFYWDGTRNEKEECRIGRAIAELYCRRDGAWDLESETSSSDESSDHDYPTSSYEPSVSRSDRQSPGSSSRAVTPNVRHDRNHHTGASCHSRAPIDHDEGNGVSEMGNKEIADRSTETTQMSVEGQVEAPPQKDQAQPSDQLRDSQAPTLPLRHEANIRAWIWDTIPETPTQHETKANGAIASGHDNIHGDVDAVDATPKPTVPTPVISGPSTTGNTHYFPRPLSAKDFSAGRPRGQPPAFPSADPDAARSAYCFPTPQTAESSSAGKPPGRSPAFPVFLSTSPINNANRPTKRPLLSSPLSGAQKRQLALEPLPRAQDPKRQRMSPSVPADLPEVIPATPADTVMSLSRNGPTSNEKIDGGRVRVRQFKGPARPGLRINTQSAGLTAPLPLETEPTQGEKLFAEFISTHIALREELDQLTRELRAATEQVTEAELRARRAENLVYHTNTANFRKFKELENKHRQEIQIKTRKCQMLEINLKDQQERNLALEMRCKGLKWTIEKAQEGLEQELQKQVSAFISEHVKTA